MLIDDELSCFVTDSPSSWFMNNNLGIMRCSSVLLLIVNMGFAIVSTVQYLCD